MPSETLAPEPVAIFTHDYHSRSPLYSWPPEQAETLNQGEVLALHMFGSLLKDIRSPRHPYFASWRDPDPLGFGSAEQGKPPSSILFHAQFGLEPVETRASLVAAAEMFTRLDHARLRLDLARDEFGAFKLKGLELEINDAAAQTGRHFRSCWQGEEIGGLDLSVQFDAPATRADPFRFHVRGRLPRRYNRGERVEQEHLSFTASGGAMPLPPWVNY